MYPNLKMYIGGQFVDGHGESSQSVMNPSNNEVLATLPYASESDLDRALESSEQAFRLWKKEPAVERSRILRKVAELIRERAENTGRVLTLEQGKPVREAIGEVLSCAEHAEWHAEECRRIYGRVIPSRKSNVQQTALKEPIGVCVAFSPWNFPFSQAFRKVVAAIGAGCTVILKGSSDTPASVMLMAQIFHDAGLPKGVFNVVSGDSGMISEYLIRSPIVQKISFTGSTPVGRKLASLAGANMKRCTMELGGHSPVMVFEDCDIEAAAKLCAAGKFRNAGQVCISPTRFFVQDSIHDKFLALFKEQVEAVKVGNGLDEDMNMGPLVAERRIEIMDGFVSDAVSKGAELLVGGSGIQSPGSFFAPTLLQDVPDTARIMTEEPFGPIAPTARFASLDEVIDRANSLPFGLAAYAFTGSARTAGVLKREIETGMLAINSLHVHSVETPFGGLKFSGYGHEGGIEGLEVFLATRYSSEIYG